MIEILRDIFRNTGARVSRRCADRRNTNCLAASLIEVGAVLGAGNPVFNVHRFSRYIGETNRSTPPSELLDVVSRGAERLDMVIGGVTVNPSFLEHCNIPRGMEQVIKQATGKQQIAKPHLRIMAKQVDDFWYTHAETDTGSVRSQQRINELECGGWISAMVVEFKRK